MRWSYRWRKSLTWIIRRYLGDMFGLLDSVVDSDTSSDGNVCKDEGGDSGSGDNEKRQELG